MSPSRHVHQGLWMPFQTCISFSLERFFLLKNQQDKISNITYSSVFIKNLVSFLSVLLIGHEGSEKPY